MKKIFKFKNTLKRIYASISAILPCLFNPHVIPGGFHIKQKYLTVKKTSRYNNGGLDIPKPSVLAWWLMVIVVNNW